MNRKQIVLKETAGGNWVVYNDRVQVGMHRRYSDAVAYCDQNNLQITKAAPWADTTRVWMQR